MRHAVRPLSVRRRLWQAGVPIAVALLAVIAAANPAAAMMISQTTWGGPGRDDAAAVAAAPDGGFYLTGTTTLPVGGEELFLIKIAENGSLLWQRSWAATPRGLYEGNDVAVAPDGSVYVTGLFAPHGTQAGDVLLLKFSPDGTLIWQQAWDSGDTETGEAVAVASDGSIYVSGGSNSLVALGPLVVLRFAPDGSLVWQRTWSDVASGDALAVGPAGTVHVAGVAPRPGGNFNFDMVLLTLTPQGALLWQRELAAGDHADARGGVAVTTDGSIYVAGGLQAVQGSTAINDTLIAEYSPNGALTWARAYGDSNDDFPGGVALLRDGTLLVGGSTLSPFVGGASLAYLLRVDPRGDGVGCSSVDGTGFDEGDDVTLAADGSVALGATTTSSPQFTLGACPQQTRSLKTNATTPAIPLAGGTGVVADPGGTAATPNGTTPGSGGFDAALVRLALP